jgi:hypothetical protein
MEAVLFTISESTTIQFSLMISKSTGVMCANESIVSHGSSFIDDF